MEDVQPCPRSLTPLSQRKQQPTFPRISFTALLFALSMYTDGFSCQSLFTPPKSSFPRSLQAHQPQGEAAHCSSTVSVVPALKDAQGTLCCDPGDSHTESCLVFVSHTHFVLGDSGRGSRAAESSTVRAAPQASHQSSISSTTGKERKEKYLFSFIYKSKTFLGLEFLDSFCSSDPLQCFQPAFGDGLRRIPLLSYFPAGKVQL